MNVPLVWPLPDGGELMVVKQTDLGPIREVKVISARSDKELEQLLKMGWQVKQ